MAMPVSAVAQLAEKNFSQKFSVLLVDDSKTRDRCLRLRYDIFANEMGADLCSNNDEMDIDDFE